MKDLAQPNRHKSNLLSGNYIWLSTASIKMRQWRQCRSVQSRKLEEVPSMPWFGRAEGAYAAMTAGWPSRSTPIGWRRGALCLASDKPPLWDRRRRAKSDDADLRRSKKRRSGLLGANLQAVMALLPQPGSDARTKTEQYLRSILRSNSGSIFVDKAEARRRQAMPTGQGCARHCRKSGFLSSSSSFAQKERVHVGERQ